MTAAGRRIILFFLVAYALSWFGWLGNWLWPGLAIWPLPNNPFGPIIATPLVIWITEDRDGVRTWLRRLGRFSRAGYGLHELQQAMSPLAASLWIGIGVLIWHAPLLMTGAIPWPFAVTLVAVSVVYAWLYQAGGSVWPLVVLHFSVNYFGGEYFGSMIAPSGQVLYSVYFGVFYVIWATWIVSRYGPGLGRSAPLSLAGQR